jgi:hypothetical protein
MIVALLALFVAFGGTGAYAVNEWNGSNIQDNTIASADLKDEDVRNVDLKPEAVGTTRLKNDDVRGTDVKDGTLGPGELDLLGNNTVATEESTTSTTIGDLATVGPSVTVNVPSSGIIAIRAQADVKGDGGGGGAVHINCGTGNFAQLFSASGASYSTVSTLPGSTAGTTFNSGWLVFDLDPGAVTCRLTYRRIGASGTGFFKNRTLWVMAVD